VCATLAACLTLYRPPASQVVSGVIQQPRSTPFGWAAQLSLTAGDGVRGEQDGAALAARFSDPYGIAIAQDGTRFVADAGDNNRIRKITPDGTVSTLAGGKEGYADGTGQAAAFHTPSGLALDTAGNLYVADTGNHRIRKVTPAGVVSTLAGDGTPGTRDGAAAQAQFNGPVGVAVDKAGRVYVADTYNDRIRLISPDGQVRTLAGGGLPGYADGVGVQARFDTPAALALDDQGNVWVADTRNNAIRKLAPDGTVSTLLRSEPHDRDAALRRPVSLVVTHDGLLYVGEMSHGGVLQIAQDGRLHVLTGATLMDQLARPAGLALAKDGTLHVSDAGSFRLYHIAPLAAGQAQPVPVPLGPAPANPLPRTQGRWPVAPQDGWHEVVGTLGEVRGNYQGESRDHLHGGLDIQNDVGAEVLAIADGKVSSPNGAWGFGELGEGLGIDDLSYIHMRVGRTAQGRLLDPAHFQPIRDEAGKLLLMRVPRGTRFHAGEVLGTTNGMAHVHLSVGAFGFERNAIALGFKGFADHQPPHIASVELRDGQNQPLRQKVAGRLLVPQGSAGLQIVVDAWDQVDDNLPRRRLGLYALGYQLLRADGTPLPGFEAPRMNIEFNRMPADDAAVKMAYAADSGITVHGSKETHFRYVVSHVVRDGHWQDGGLSVQGLPAGDYTLRITARDYSGNVANQNRDLLLAVR
ncbi:MAG TPA: NHL repeat-containing protein, partial [Chitinimonas sp.]